MTRHRRYVIAHVINGRPVEWFRYSRRHVWVWVRNRHRATLFRTEDDAIHAANSCSVSWLHAWRVDRHK